MIVDAIIVERIGKIQIFSPKLSKGMPIRTLSDKYKDKKIKLVTSFTDIEEDKPECKCEYQDCGYTQYPRNYLRDHILPRNTCITCNCCDDIYIIVPEVFLK